MLKYSENISVNLAFSLLRTLVSVVCITEYSFVNILLVTGFKKEFDYRINYNVFKIPCSFVSSKIIQMHTLHMLSIPLFVSFVLG